MPLICPSSLFPLKSAKTGRMLNMSSAKTFCFNSDLCCKIMYEVCYDKQCRIICPISTTFRGVLWTLAFQSTPRESVDLFLIQGASVKATNLTNDPEVNWIANCPYQGEHWNQRQIRPIIQHKNDYKEIMNFSYIALIIYQVKRAIC